jgi:hypothetical protein
MSIERNGLQRRKRKRYPCGVDSPSSSYGSSASSSYGSSAQDQIVMQTLEGFVLPLLPAAPPQVHNIHLKCTAANDPEYYNDMQYPIYKRNMGKHHVITIDQVKTRYVFYPGGTIDISTNNSNNPITIQTETDRLRLLAFLQKISNNLPYQVVVPEVGEWEFKECDINRDVKVSDLLHFAGVKVQVKHLDHLFRIYIKRIGGNTYCRVEETKALNRSVIEAIYHLFNPNLVETAQ